MEIKKNRPQNITPEFLIEIFKFHTMPAGFKQIFSIDTEKVP
jgi:hypothetical protein